MLKAFSDIPDIEVGLLVVGDDKTTQISPVEQLGINALQDAGIEVLQPLALPDNLPRRSRIKRLIAPKIVDRYPQCSHRELIENRIKSWQAECMIVVWSEWLTHACSDVKIKKFAYYGNPDPKATRIQLKLRHRNGEIGILRLMGERIWNKVFEKMHLREMKKYEYLGNVAKNDALYYTNHGHKNSFYIQNIWMMPPVMMKSVRLNGSVRIIANIGKLGATANTLGLEYLGKYLLPILKEKLKNHKYEIHLIGSGKVHPIAERALFGHDVIWRGYVDDIDREIRDCDVFLCVNNASEYKVGHTRYLHAWSLRALVVAHCDATCSMPEIQDGVNTLLGKNPEEIAEHILQAIQNKELAENIRETGYETYLRHFVAEKVVERICAQIRA